MSRLPDFEEGRKYVVRHKSPQQELVRQSLMTFLSRNGNDTSWSARPVAGTQTLPDSWIVDAEPVGSNQTCYVNRVRR